jgi:hypothetical protein
MKVRGWIVPNFEQKCSLRSDSGRLNPNIYPVFIEATVTASKYVVPSWSLTVGGRVLVGRTAAAAIIAVFAQF